MYQVLDRFSTNSEANRRSGLWSDSRFGKRELKARPRERRSRRYLAYAGLLVGFCLLLAFAGCGTIEGNGQLTAAGGVNFGAVTVGKTSTATVSFMNTGSSAVSVSSVNVAGAPFALAGSIHYPVSVAAGSTYSFQVQFTPSAAGQVSGAVTAMTNAAATSPTVNLSGLGVDTTTGSSPGSLSAITCNSSLMLGAGTDNCSVELSGQAGSGGVSVNLASSSTAATVPASVTVPEGATGIGFTTTVAAVATTQSATLTASAGGVSQTFALQLSAAQRVLSANTSQVAFGFVALNSTATQSVVLTSSGTQAVTVQSASLAGAGFSIGALALPVTLNPGQSITIQLQFVSSIAGAAAGQITITSNATAGGTMAIPLTATGAIPYAVDLTWAAPASSADPVVGYKVYRSLSGGSSYQLLNSTVNTGTTFTDATVADGQSYVYYVTSVDLAGAESVPSNPFNVSIP